MQRTGIKKWLESTPLFLVLVPLYVLVHLEKVFHHLIVYRYAATQIIILILACLSCYFLAQFIEKDRRKYWVIAFVLMVFWCYFGLVKNLLEHRYQGYIFSSYTVLIPFSAIVLAGLIFLIKKLFTKFSRFFLFVNSVWILFILIDVFSMLFYDIQKPSQEIKYAFNLPKTVVADSVKPDIYYIVLDSYSSNVILKLMGSDNEAIERKLSNKGFRIVNGSCSNYNLTPFSISSTLNMKYLEEASTEKKYSLNEFLPGVQLVKYNGLFPWLRQQGYNIVNYSFFDFPENPANIETHDVWDIEAIFLQQNAGWKVYRDVSWNFNLPALIGADKIQEAVDLRDVYDDSVYQRLISTPAIKSSQPRFIYAHFFSPHIPNSRDSIGNKIPVNTKLSVPQEMARYTEEIKFVNKRIDTITNALLENPKRPLVIIIQGDHGYRFYDPQKTSEEFPNFCAVYFSNKDYRLLSDTITNVNLFKVVLNTWFNQHIQLDTNRHYFLQYN